MADLGSHDERKRALLTKCDAIWAIAEVGRSYVDKQGELHSQPDASALCKVTELAARLMGVMAESEKLAKESDGETKPVEIEQLVGFMRSIGYKVEKAA